MVSYKLKAHIRKTLGRKVKNLRNQGILPANIYGKKIKSQAVQVDLKDFLAVFNKTGETGLIQLDLEGKNLPILIHNVSYHVVDSQPLHADFYQVDLKEKVIAEVPLEIIGEPQAVKEKLGVLLNILSEIEVEALPTDLPDKIEVAVDNLKNVDDAVKVADLKVDDKVKILTDGNLEIVKIAPLVSKEAEELIAEEAAKKEAEVVEEGVEVPAEAAPGEEAKAPEAAEQPVKEQTSK